MSGPDDDRVRGFSAFAARRRGRGRFARSWWGTAWIEALEDTALDAGQLRKGRRCAYAGQVGTITVSPGRVAAPVDDGMDDGPYRTVVRVERLSDAAWERFVDRVAGRSGHVAALLEADMPRELVDTAADAGVPLLPGIGDLEPECDCPGWEYPCRHAAALCYQVAWLLDADPFVLFLLRGRGARELLAQLQVRDVSAVGPDPAATVWDEPGPGGVLAGDVLGRAATPLPAPGGAEDGAVSPADPELFTGMDAGVDPRVLAGLVDVAVGRARELLGGPEGAAT